MCAALYTGANPTIADTAQGWTALHCAAWGECVEAMELLLSTGAKIDSPDKGGETPLCLAASKNLEMVKLLLNSGADIHCTALHKAALNGKADIVKYLLAAGADVNALDRYQATALHWCTLSTDTETMKIILAGGGDVNVQHRDGLTPLHVVIDCYRRTSRSSPRTMTDSDALCLGMLLLEAGADSTLRDNEGKAAVDRATETGLTDLVHLMNNVKPFRRTGNHDVLSSSTSSTSFFFLTLIFILLGCVFIVFPNSSDVLVLHTLRVIVCCVVDVN